MISLLALSSHEPGELIQVVGACSPQVSEHVLSLASLLKSWGYAVSVVGEIPKDFAKDLAHANVPSFRVPVPANTSLPSKYAAARNLAQLLSERKPALIHAHGLRAGLHVLMGRRRGFAPPMVCTPNLLPHLLQNGADRFWRANAYRYVLRRSDAIIAASKVQRHELGRLAPVVEESVAVVPYGIDARRYHDSVTIGRRRELLGINPTAAVVGCMVDLTPPATVKLFLDAAAEICRDQPNLEFALIGGTDRADEYYEMAHERGLLGATVFLTQPVQIAKLLTPLNAIVIPQMSWPSGQVALQALIRGLGVVAFAGSETDEMLAESSGVTIVPETQPEALAYSIIERLKLEVKAMRPLRDGGTPAEVSQFLVSRESWDLDRSWQRPQSISEGALSPIAAEAAASFSITQMARETIAVYHDLLDRHGHS